MVAFGRVNEADAEQRFRIHQRKCFWIHFRLSFLCLQPYFLLKVHTLTLFLKKEKRNHIKKQNLITLLREYLLNMNFVDPLWVSSPISPKHTLRYQISKLIQSMPNETWLTILHPKKKSILGEKVLFVVFSFFFLFKTLTGAKSTIDFHNLCRSFWFSIVHAVNIFYFELSGLFKGFCRRSRFQLLEHIVVLKQKVLGTFIRT